MTIKKELENRGIKPVYLNIVYDLIKKKEDLTKIPDYFPDDSKIVQAQYELVIQYLQDREVLDEQNNVNSEALEVFEIQRDLEKRMEEAPKFDSLRSSGGIAPCRSSRMLGSTGGLMPCRR